MAFGNNNKLENILPLKETRIWKIGYFLQIAWAVLAALISMAIGWFNHINIFSIAGLVFVGIVALISLILMAIGEKKTYDRLNLKGYSVIISVFDVVINIGMLVIVIWIMIRFSSFFSYLYRNRNNLPSVLSASAIYSYLLGPAIYLLPISILSIVLNNAKIKRASKALEKAKSAQAATNEASEETASVEQATAEVATASQTTAEVASETQQETVTEGNDSIDIEIDE